MRAKPATHAPDVIARRLICNPKSLGDLSRRTAASQKVENFVLTRCQRIFRRGRWSMRLVFHVGRTEDTDDVPLTEERDRADLHR